MILGSYTFALLPGQMTIIKPGKPTAVVETYTDVGFFSWTPTIIGQIITLNWNAMTTAQFDSMDTIYQADTEIVFDPTDYIGSTTYNVEVLSFNGDYWAGIDLNRLNCALELLIMSEV